MSNMRMRTVIWYGERLENYEMRKLYPGSFLHGEWRDTKRYYQSAESEDTGLHKEKRLDTRKEIFRLKAKKEIALSMAEEGMDVKKVARLVKVSEDDIQKWINENMCVAK